LSEDFWRNQSTLVPKNEMIFAKRRYMGGKPRFADASHPHPDPDSTWGGLLPQAGQNRE